MTPQLSNISTFPYLPFYLDTVCGKGNWQVLVSKDKNGFIQGILPFQKKRKWGLPIIVPPPLSPRLGPWIFYPPIIKTDLQRQDYEQLVLTDLVQQLPFFIYARIQWPYSLSNGHCWQQLDWEKETRYSYQLDLTKESTVLQKAFKPQVRNKINKAKKHLKIEHAENPQALISLMHIAAKHRNETLPISPELATRLIQNSLQQQQGQLWYAKTADGKIVGGHFIFWNKDTAYNLFLESDPSFRSLGTAPGLLWKSILFVQQKGLKVYDFEGSHLPGVAAFFNSFGATPRPYLRFTKWHPFLNNTLFRQVNKKIRNLLHLCRRH